jgi:hypothetical protein
LPFKSRFKLMTLACPLPPSAELSQLDRSSPTA